MTRQGLRGLIAFAFALTGAAPIQAQTQVTIPYATDAGSSLWQIRAEGNLVTTIDARGALHGSISPSNGLAPDCMGITQLTPLLEDANGDGLIDAAHGERARLVVNSSWREGDGWRSAVLALDVSRPGQSRLLWRRDGDALPRLARIVAAPTVARLRVGTSNRDPRHFVVIVGGGLPTRATQAHAARDGVAMMLLDAQDGTLLWTAAASGTADQHFATLNAGVSGAVTALDVDRDGFADRFYVGDAQASVWRFDVVTDTSSTLRLAGAPLARLAATNAPDARSIIAAPDVTLLSPPGSAPWFNVAVGTVHAAGTSDSATRQGLFVLRDHHPFETLTQVAYDRLTPVVADDLPVADAAPSGDTPLPASAPGYRIDLSGDGTVARTLTAGGVLLYAQVTAGDPLNACAVAAPIVIVSVGAATALDGHAALDLDANGRVDAADRAVALASGAANALDSPRLERDAAADGRLRCRVGNATLATCPRITRLTRRFWRREDAD